MKLFDKITHWGYENEYPLRCRKPSSDEEGYYYIKEHDPEAIKKWNIHYDGGGLEFTVITPQDSVDLLKEKVIEIYDYIESLVYETGYEDELEDGEDESDYTLAQLDAIYADTRFTTEDDIFNSNEAGVHIRIDVTTWNTTERLRFCRLFSEEFSESDNYIDYLYWFRDVLGRDWCNWNSPFDYLGEYRSIMDGFSTRSKRYNVQFEKHFNDSDRDTIEIRGFGVHKDLTEALKQVDSIKTLCDIVDVSLELKGNSPVIDKLYYAWQIVTGCDGVSIAKFNEAIGEN